MPEERFIPPLACPAFELENRRHPEPSEVEGLPVRSLVFMFEFTLAPRSACCAPDAPLNPPAGVRTPGVGLATPFWFVPLEKVCPEAAPLRCIDCCICDTCRSNDGGAAAGRDFEKKRCCWLPRCNDDVAAGRLVTDNASRVGTTGRFPVIMRPPRKVSPFTPTGRLVPCRTVRSEPSRCHRARARSPQPYAGWNTRHLHEAVQSRQIRVPDRCGSY